MPQKIKGKNRWEKACFNKKGAHWGGGGMARTHKAFNLCKLSSTVNAVLEDQCNTVHLLFKILWNTAASIVKKIKNVAITKNSIA